ncbi:MAG: Smr/MutS family protein [Deferribacterales bacterium]
MNHIDQIDFTTFKQNILKSSESPFSNDIINSLKPLNNLNLIITEQNCIGEILDIFSRFEGKLPESKPYYDFYQRLMDPYASFLVEDLLIFAYFHLEVNKFKKELLGGFEINHLKPLLSSIYSMSDLIGEILSKVSDDGTVKDDASDKLLEIRSEAKVLKNRIYESLNRILNSKDADKFVQEKVIKLYNNRLVLLLRQNFKQYINGIVHTISGTGLTLYVEPSGVIENNNRYQELLSLEELEIKRILSELLEKIKSNLYEITETIKAVSKLYYYKVLYRYYNGRRLTFPIFSDKIKLEKVHHPIIYDAKGENSVPIDFYLDEKIHIAVITGPNAGGKTAALKSIGLNTVIAKCGLPIFASYAELINFDNIYADIGDYQSLIMDLSTFTSHMINIKDITNKADGYSLVLLDELGTGTDPKEGEALAIAILEFLKMKKVKVVVTTHFTGVRNYGIKNESAILYGVDFDYENFQPRYKLIKNLIGKSDPIIIAKRLGFNKDILEIAEMILTEDKANATLSFDELNRMKMELEAEKILIQEKVEELSLKEKELVDKEKELREKLKKKEFELLEETYSLLNKVKSQQMVKGDKSILKDVENKVEERLNCLKDEKKINDIEVGDTVFLEKYGKKAKILKIEKNKAYVDMEGIKVNINLNDLIGYKVEEKQIKKESIVSVTAKVNKRGGYEIVLVGKTVDEAWDELDKFIDKALISGWDRIYVINGRGSGALRKGLHNLLKNDKRVKSFRIADLAEGGQAVTIVEL